MEKESEKILKNAGFSGKLGVLFALFFFYYPHLTRICSMLILCENIYFKTRRSARSLIDAKHRRRGHEYRLHLKHLFTNATPRISA